MQRSPEKGWALCLHEAAHAVTAEVLRPGCVLGIEVDVQPGVPVRSGVGIFAAGVDGVCAWDNWDYDAFDHLVAVAAGRQGEIIAEDEQRLDWGDERVLRVYANAAVRRKARRRAAQIVRHNELWIRRVARALQRERYLAGDEIRALRDGGHVREVMA